jgi:hypothetical protein
MKKGIYIFKPVMFDRYQENTKDLAEGTRLRVVQPRGCPKNGTMGMCYTETLEGRFVGLVCVNSLQRI